jgi:hypothetical protein
VVPAVGTKLISTTIDAKTALDVMNVSTDVLKHRALRPTKGDLAKKLLSFSGLVANRMANKEVLRSLDERSDESDMYFSGSAAFDSLEIPKHAANLDDDQSWVVLRDWETWWRYIDLNSMLGELSYLPPLSDNFICDQLL